MSKIDTYGSNANLKDGPRSMDHLGTRGGTIDRMTPGASLKNEPASNLPSSNGRQPEMGGKGADLSNSPMKGWQSADTPMSDRAIRQSK